MDMDKECTIKALNNANHLSPPAFVVQNLTLFDDWDWSNTYDDNGEPYKDTQTFLIDLKRERPIYLYMDGSVYAFPGSQSIDICAAGAAYSPEEFYELWREYGYSDISICF